MALGKDCYPLQVDRYGVGEYLLRNRDLYLFSYRIVGLGIDSNVLSLCYLPQLLHFAPGASENRSLASVDLLKLDLRTQ